MSYSYRVQRDGMEVKVNSGNGQPGFEGFATVLRGGARGWWLGVRDSGASGAWAGARGWWLAASDTERGGVRPAGVVGPGEGVS